MAYPLRPLYDRWVAKVDMSGGPTACWRWRGAKSLKRRGARRGIIRVGRRIISAARVALALATDGDYDKRDAEGMKLEAGHRTDLGCIGATITDDCVNPAHLYWCTREQNEQDKRRALGAVA